MDADFLVRLIIRTCADISYSTLAINFTTDYGPAIDARKTRECLEVAHLRNPGPMVNVEETETSLVDGLPIARVGGLRRDITRREPDALRRGDRNLVGPSSFLVGAALTASSSWVGTMSS